MWLLVAQRITIEFFLDFLFFPIWWYTYGMKKAFFYCLNLFLNAFDRLAPLLWLKNIFVPMFGQRDWQGRIVSFFMRFINVILRGVTLFFVFLIIVLLFFVWAAFPFFVSFMLVSSLF